MTFPLRLSTVLFQGDSITDAGRIYSDPNDLGNGYAALIAAWYSAQHPHQPVRFLNRGISGNRASDLRSRWQADCLDLHADVVSVLIGINDTWRRYDSHDPTSTSEFADHYHAILRSTKESGARIVMLEPFVLPVPQDRRGWREDLDPKIAAVRDLAREFSALYIPLDGIFAAASTQKPCGFWAEDGVHPTLAGHALIAQAWLQRMGQISQNG